MLDEPLDDREVRRLLRELLTSGSVRFWDHARDEMDDDDLDEGEVLRVLRFGVWDGCDFERRRWRYRRRLPGIVVVVQLSESLVEVVTAWRER